MHKIIACALAFALLLAPAVLTSYAASGNKEKTGLCPKACPKVSAECQAKHLAGQCNHEKGKCEGEKACKPENCKGKGQCSHPEQGHVEQK